MNRTLLLSAVLLWAVSSGIAAQTNAKKMEQATLGAGCFWCVEAIFSQIKGVQSVEAGYAGGKVRHPTYREVCSGLTGHAEVIRIHFDPRVVSYDDMLRVFFGTHDPTTLNRQGADVGTQYRSVIFYHDERQKRIAEAVKQEIEKKGIYDDPIVTAIEPLTNYYPAEKYHQDYFANNPDQPYCRAVINPKLRKFREKFRHLLKD